MVIELGSMERLLGGRERQRSLGAALPLPLSSSFAVSFSCSFTILHHPSPPPLLRHSPSFPHPRRPLLSPPPSFHLFPRLPNKCFLISLDSERPEDVEGGTGLRMMEMR